MERETWCGEGGGFVPGDPHSPHCPSSAVLAPTPSPLRQAQGFALLPPHRPAARGTSPPQAGARKGACIASAETVQAGMLLRSQFNALVVVPGALFFSPHASGGKRCPAHRDGEGAVLSLSKGVS